jgi:hypothetical protein
MWPSHSTPARIFISSEIRIYAMHYFNETADYFGDKEKPTVSADNRMSVRSVKIFADGIFTWSRFTFSSRSIECFY